VSVVILSGKPLNGVVYGTAAGTGDGYLMGPAALAEMLKVGNAGHQAVLLGVKYYHHQGGESRRFVPDESDRDYAVTILVDQGRWRQRLWSDLSGESMEVLLTAPGDYIAWPGAGLKHFWSAVEKSTMLTIRWRPLTAGEEPQEQVAHGKEECREVVLPR
jgi:hypothetical protein